MIVIRVLLQIKADVTENFVHHMKQETKEMQSFEGCERFALYSDVSDENTFLLYEEWQTQHHFDAYKNSETFKKNGEKVFPMIAGKPDSAYFSAELL